MTSVFQRLIDLLRQQGVFEVYLPFLLTFALFYALLKRTKIFDFGGKGGNNIPILISAVAALYVTIFSPVAIPISQFFAAFFTEASIAFLVILLTIMLAGMLFFAGFFEFDQKLSMGVVGKWLAAIAGVVALTIFVTSGGLSLFANIVPPDIGISGLSGEDIALIIVILITIGIIWFVASGEESEDKKPKEFKLVEG